MVEEGQSRSSRGVNETRTKAKRERARDYHKRDEDARFGASKRPTKREISERKKRRRTGLSLNEDSLRRRVKDGERRFVGRNRRNRQTRHASETRIERLARTNRPAEEGRRDWVMSEAPWFNRTRRCAADWPAPLWNARPLSATPLAMPLASSASTPPLLSNHHYRPSRLTLLRDHPRASQQHTASPLPVATHDRDRELLAMEPILSRSSSLLEGN